MESIDIVRRSGAELVPAESVNPLARLVEQKAQIQEAMKAVMKENEHYGVIPGCKKPSLWQPGADTLCLLFGIGAQYEVVTSVERDDFLAYSHRCRLVHRDSLRTWGEGMGGANSREKRYVEQSSQRLCPSCNGPFIIKGKEEYGGGWLCWAKKGGCGAKFPDDDGRIADQGGTQTAQGVWDLQNTLIKMSSKRAKVAAVLTATAASDIFTQDLEDLVDAMPGLVQKSDIVNRPGERPFVEHPPAHEQPHLNDEYTEPVDIIEPNTGEVVGHRPGITAAQSKLIHSLLDKLGHLMDGRRAAKKAPGKGGKVLEPAKVIVKGKYHDHLLEKYGKKSTDQLAIDEANQTIDWLQDKHDRYARNIPQMREPGEEG
jgi:hypothetical protein